MMWEKVRLDDICDLITCGVAKRPDYTESGIPFLSSQNVKENKIILNSYKFISEASHYELTKHNKPQKGDILYTRVGSFGEAAVVNLDFEFSVFVSLTLIKPKIDIIDSRFLMWYLNSPTVRDFASNNTSGIGVQNLNVGVVREYKIPLPPLPIQKRIAEILDTADALRRKDEALLKKYDELAQAIFIDMFGDPVKNEKGWEVKKLKSCTSKIGSGSTPTGGKTAYKEQGISLIRSMNVYDNYFKMKDLAFIDDIQAEKLKNVEVKSNDVLFNITGASVCRCTIVPEEILPARVNQHVAILRAKEELLSPKFLSTLLTTNSMKKQLLNIGMAGGAVMEAITKDQLENQNIILPPIEVQNRFANILKNLNEQNQKSSICQKESDSLFNSLLQKAFNGELVA